eukprot:6259804-Alexandrium_andersonii.AAC.1
MLLACEAVSVPANQGILHVAAGSPPPRHAPTESEPRSNTVPQLQWLRRVGPVRAQAEAAFLCPDEREPPLARLPEASNIAPHPASEALRVGRVDVVPWPAQF